MDDSIPPLHIVESLAQAAAVLDPTRAALLRELVDPDSASGLSRKLGLPRQRLNYHLRELENAGLIRCVREQRKGNCTERIVQSIARRFVINPDVLAQSPREAPSCAAQPNTAFAAGIEVRLASAQDHAAFMEDLMNEAAKLAAEYATDSPAVEASLFVLSRPR